MIFKNKEKLLEHNISVNKLGKSREHYISVNGYQIRIQIVHGKEYISLTDLAKIKSSNSNQVINHWIRVKSTIHLLIVWETMYNLNFKSAPISTFTSKKKINMSPGKWIRLTNAIGIISERGRYSSGIFAHRDIAMEFLSWLSPRFKLYEIQELQRLKENETKLSNLHNDDWERQSCRSLSKTNYELQTHAIQKYIVSGKTNPSKEYAIEADLINEVVFQTTAKQFQKKNPSLVLKGQNVRDTANTIELTVLANMEAYNSHLIAQNLPRSTRHKLLILESKRQFSIFYKKKIT